MGKFEWFALIAVIGSLLVLALLPGGANPFGG